MARLKKMRESIPKTEMNVTTGLMGNTTGLAFNKGEREKESDRSGLSESDGTRL